MLASSESATAVTIFSNVKLLNDWAPLPAPSRPPGVSLVSGIVHMKGAIAGGTTALAFKVPLDFRPASMVFVRVDLCKGTPGRIIVTPAGDAYVQADGPFADAKCRVSLEGASYALNGSGVTPLSLQNGWINGLFGTSVAGARNIGGIVQLSGAITGGTSSQIATFPPALRPVTDVYLPVGLCDTAPGRLQVQPSGLISVFTTDGTQSTAKCFVSLEGAALTRTGSGFSTVVLENGWTGAPFGTDQPGYLDVSGVLNLKGAVSGGTSVTLFTLPTQYRPPTDIRAPVDLCNALVGTLSIAPTGVVSVSAPSVFADAACFTSLEGVSFALSSFVPLQLVNGWTESVFRTGAAAVARNGNVISFSGAVGGGSSSLIATLAPPYRPPTDVYVAVDLCNGARGRLYVRPSGEVLVQAVGGFPDAQCFTSLEGASFVLPTAKTKLLSLQNGWLGSPYGTNLPRVQDTGGIVRFSGAVASGTASAIFELPAAYRPASDVYLPVTLCNALKGRLYIAKRGVVQVFSEKQFSDARCFTSLDGLAYSTTGQGAVLATVNGWTQGAFGTFPLTVSDSAGIVRLGGAVSGGTTDTIAVLPVKFRPLVNIYVPLDLCGGAKGRLVIQSNGDVRVFSAGTFASAQCFTSLEGVSYAL